MLTPFFCSNTFAWLLAVWVKRKPHHFRVYVPEYKKNSQNMKTAFSLNLRKVELCLLVYTSGKFDYSFF